MATDDRTARLAEYRQKSHLVDEFFDFGKIKEALELLHECRNKSIEAGDEDYRLFFDAELIGYTSPDYPMQLALLDEALTLPLADGTQPDSFILRCKGVYLSNMGDGKAAIEMYDRALALMPDDYHTLRNKGATLCEMGDEKGAIELYDRALAIKPDDYNSLSSKGVALSIMGDQKGAIELYDRALAIKPDDYNSLRNKGVALSRMGDEKGAIELYDRALAIKPDDYHSLRSKGASLSEMGDEKGAIELYDRALAIKPDDYNSLSSKGVALSKMGDNEEAIKLFDKALAIKPDGHHSLRQLGVVLSKMGNEKGAIELFDKALAIKPDDYHSLQQKGVALSKLGDNEGAIELFDKALGIKPDDYHVLRQKGVALSRMGDETGAIQLYNKALAIKPDDVASIRSWAVSAYNLGAHAVAQDKIKHAVQLDPEKYKDDFYTIMRLTETEPEREWKSLFPNDVEVPTESNDRLQDIRDFVGVIRKNLGEKGREFLEQKLEAESNVKKFLHPESLLAQDSSFFLVLRKWNSYTPAIPSDKDERSLGGGYFIYHNGKGTVIDPGYNFIENFYSAGCRIRDIDNIVITHAHNDHTIDFESICTLLYKYNDETQMPQRPKKKINLYFNNGSFKKFSGLLNLKDRNFEGVYTLNVGNNYQLNNGVNLTVLPAFHDEVVSRDGSVGLLFILKCNDNIRKIILTSDTGLFPLCKDSEKPKPNTSGQELWEKYPVSAMEKLDLLVVHIGSIKDEEFNVDLNTGIGNCLYPNHLGMIGTARMITKLKPSLALVSEFGEEMRNFRRDIVERIEQDVVNKVVTTEAKPRVAPADLAFIYDIANAKFLCCADGSWSNVSEITYDYEDTTKENLYYFCKENLGKIGMSDYADRIKEFKRRMNERKGMYFRPEEVRNE